MLKAFPFGEWTPDLAPTGTVTVAQNVYPIANGYTPVPRFSPITPALASAFMGGAAFVSSDGSATLLAATSAHVYKYSGTTLSSVSNATATRRVRFAQFGDNILFANGGSLKSYSLLTASTTTPTAAPDAIDVARVRDFVMALTTANEAQWSQFNDSSDFTGGINQADTQPLLGGKGVAIVGGQYGIILRNNGIDRVTYTGGDTVFQFDEISAEIGCMSQGSVVNHGRLIGFLSERGFELCDGETVVPIGDEKFNRWFFDTYSREDIQNIWAAVDPRRSHFLWAMPGSPGRVLVYNWTLKQATFLSLNVSGLFTGFTANTSLEALDTLYPDGLESVPVSLDDPSLAGGSPLLLVVDSSNVIGTLSGSSLEATVTHANIEPSPTKRSRIRSVRPITDATNVTAQIDARMKVADAEARTSAATMRSNGKMPARSNGRYNSITLTIPAGETWTYLQGYELEFEAGDGR